VRRKHHARACKRKEISESEVVKAGVRAYLADLGLTWPAFAKFHNRLDYAFCRYSSGEEPFCKRDCLKLLRG